MESFVIENLTFTYPDQKKPALIDISLNIAQGEFITICGKSGCGKSTLLKHLKSCFMPAGERKGKVLLEGQSLDELDQRIQSEKIGFVLQDPDNQIVTDKVWHELAFGLESLGYSNEDIRARVAEMASFFGIQNWFHKNTTELSGGQKQLLNLAAIMVMQPSVLILDEPTSQLDPITAQDFLETIAKINRELGTTIILTEHRLEEAFPLSDRVILMENGSILVDGTPREVGERLKVLKNDMFIALPTPMRIYAQVPNDEVCPITVREGRKWLEQLQTKNIIMKELINKEMKDQPVHIDKTQAPLIELKETWFRYEEKSEDILKNLNLKIYEGEWLCIVGGNGAGKSTMLSIISGIHQPYRGAVLFKGTKLKKSDRDFKEQLAMLPQNPKALFVNQTVREELQQMLSEEKISSEEKKQRLKEVIKICELEEVLDRHPYDLSGGQQQRAALAKVLLKAPRILLLDEPTKGLDAHYKLKLARILQKLREKMKLTIVMVSHDIEFCASYGLRCAMFFDGNIVSEAPPRTFFAGKSFYTTATNRMARKIIKNAVIPEDVIRVCGSEPYEINDATSEEQTVLTTNKLVGQDQDWEKITFQDEIALQKERVSEDNLADQIKKGSRETTEQTTKQIPKQTLKQEELTNKEQKSAVVQNRSHLWLSLVMILLVMPLTIWLGITLWGDRKYYFVSMLLIIEIFIPFIYRFEHKKMQAREVIMISVLCAIGVAGRIAFYMVPSVKPLTAIVIISAVCLGGETGFLIGAISAFSSNMFFGQGPWTPWQMFTFGLIGFVAGFLSERKLLSKKRVFLCLYGFLSTVFIFGGIMNAASVLIYQPQPTIPMFISAYAMGFPFDMIHAVFTVLFIGLLAEPMISKIQRIQVKYDLLEKDYSQ